MTAEAGSGKASFRRLGPAQRELDVEYSVDGGTAELPEGDLQTGVAVLCEQEIATMRRTLGELGEALASQLRDDGKDALIRRNWNNRWSRSWRDNRTAFWIDAADTRMRETMNGYEGVSEARLVRTTVAAMIEQREQNIRQMYGKILEDATMNRRTSDVEAGGRLPEMPN